ncbi:MAG TPA: MBL fold metallo-hydrolase [Candidatus Binatia bacterium]|nr:MBL fold metallo-hydrolase [Candidatus Binatia bacterium]
MPVARLRPISRHIAAVDLHGRFQVAVFLVRHERGLLLVDAGFPGWAYAVLTAAASLPQPNRITHVVLTHAHADHVGGASEIARVMGAEILCSEDERPYVEGRSLARAAHGIFPRALLAVHERIAQRRVERPRVDATLAEDERLLGLRVVSVPGHTPGQIGLVHEEDRVVLCADAVFHVEGRLGYDPVPGLTLDASAADRSLARIAELGVQDVVPSHGPAILGDAPDRIRDFLESRR